MASFLAVARTELLLLWRSRGVRAAIPLLALAGMVAASRIREAPWGAWSQFSFTIALATLALTLAGGDGIGRDRERRLDGGLCPRQVPGRRLRGRRAARRGVAGGAAHRSALRVA